MIWFSFMILSGSSCTDKHHPGAWILCASLIWWSFSNFFLSVVALKNIILSCRPCGSLFWLIFTNFLSEVKKKPTPSCQSCGYFSDSNCTKKITLSCRPCDLILCASLIWLSFINFLREVTLKHYPPLPAVCLDVICFLYGILPLSLV